MRIIIDFDWDTYGKYLEGYRLFSDTTCLSMVVSDIGIEHPIVYPVFKKADGTLYTTLNTVTRGEIGGYDIDFATIFKQNALAEIENYQATLAPYILAKDVRPDFSLLELNRRDITGEFGTMISDTKDFLSYMADNPSDFTAGDKLGLVYEFTFQNVEMPVEGRVDVASLNVYTLFDNNENPIDTSDKILKPFVDFKQVKIDLNVLEPDVAVRGFDDVKIIGYEMTIFKNNQPKVIGTWHQEHLESWLRMIEPDITAGNALVSEYGRMIGYSIEGTYDIPSVYDDTAS